MKIGDLVQLKRLSHRSGGVFGIIVCIDPEDIGDSSEVEVLWTSGFTGRSTHSIKYLELLNESR